MRYCNVSSCKYFRGIKDAGIQLFRPPTGMDWLAKWNMALSKTKCSVGHLTCIRHFSSNDLIKRDKNRYALRPLAVPTIFDLNDGDTVVQTNDGGPIQNISPECDDRPTICILDDETLLQSNDVIFVLNDDTVVQTNDGRPIENISPECDDRPTICILDDETILQSNALPIQTVVPECNCASLQQMIQTQSNEILRLKDKIVEQSNQLLSLNRKIQAQSEELTKLNTFKSKLQCGLVRFATEAKDSKALRQKEILSCLACGIRSRESYSQSVRNFCIGLKNISPAGYRFIRNEFSDRIPSEVTIRNWYSNADLSCNPGIINYSLKVLRRKVEEMAVDNKELIGALIFDEMSIHKLLQFTNNEMLGFENVPTIAPKDRKVASEALVFIFNGIDTNLKLPVAYYYTNKLDADSKAVLIKDMITSLLETGVIVTSITFDGARENPAMCEILGVDLDVFSNSFDPSFTFNGNQINIVFDPSHDIKLVRGSLSDRGTLYDSDGKSIEWAFFTKLVKFNQQRNFGESVHKMTQAHINWASDPMKVRLAVETFSASTARAMEYLMNQGFSQFRNAAATIRFTRWIDDTFNVCNSTKTSFTKENVLKRPWNVDNIPQILNFCEESIEYIKGLQVKTGAGRLVPLCSSGRKTGFQGFIVCMRSFINIYNEFVINKSLISNFTTHSLSQDHLEQLFGSIRSFNGANNNPTCQQFNAAMRKVLASTTLHAPKKGNCTVLEDSGPVQNPYSNILSITSRKTKRVAPCTHTNMELIDEDIEPILTELSAIRESTNKLIDLSDLTTANIALNIERRMERKFTCQPCTNVFPENPKVHQAFQSHSNSRKTCQSTFEICQTANYFLKMEVLKGQYDFKFIQEAIYHSLSPESLFPNSDFDDHPDHLKKDLIYCIIDHFIKIKGQYIAKSFSFKEHNQQVRRNLSKLIHHYNQ